MMLSKSTVAACIAALCALVSPCGAAEESWQGLMSHAPADANVLVQTAIEHNGVRLVPFAAQWLRINGENVYLIRSPAGPVWRQTAPDKPGSFEALILDNADTPVARVERQYVIHSVIPRPPKP